LQDRASTDVTANSNQLEELVASAQYQYFFDRLLDFAKDFGDNNDRYEVLLKCGVFTEISGKLRKGTITEEYFITQRSKLVMAALSHKDEIYEKVILRLPPVPPGLSGPPPSITSLPGGWAAGGAV